jgi:hypothetical protein
LALAQAGLTSQPRRQEKPRNEKRKPKEPKPQQEPKAAAEVEPVVLETPIAPITEAPPEVKNGGDDSFDVGGPV